MLAGITSVAASFALVAMWHSCVSHTPIRMDSPADPTVEIVWPAPPDTARIQYLRSITTPADLGVKPSLLGRVAGLVFGEGDELRVRQPYGVFVDGAQRIYVADEATPGVHMFDPTRGQHRLYRGSDRRSFEVPVGVVANDKGDIFVSDAKGGVVIGMDEDGDEFLELSEGIERPAGLALDQERGILYVVDVRRHAVLAFDRSGKLIRVLGERGTELGQMNFPTNAAVASDGTVYVTDTMNFRVQTFTPEGDAIAAFGVLGNRPGEFARPKGIGVDSQGHVYVVEGLYDAINVFDSRGRFLLTFGQEGHRAGEFWLATGLFVDANDRVYVSDSFNGRVQVFQYLAASGPR